MMLTKAAMKATHVHTALRGRRACTCCGSDTMVNLKRAQRRRDRQAFRTGRVEY